MEYYNLPHFHTDKEIIISPLLHSPRFLQHKKAQDPKPKFHDFMKSISCKVGRYLGGSNMCNYAHFVSTFLAKINLTTLAQFAFINGLC